MPVPHHRNAVATLSCHATVHLLSLISYASLLLLILLLITHAGDNPWLTILAVALLPQFGTGLLCGSLQWLIPRFNAANTEAITAGSLMLTRVSHLSAVLTGVSLVLMGCWWSMHDMGYEHSRMEDNGTEGWLLLLGEVMILSSGLALVFSLWPSLLSVRRNESRAHHDDDDDDDDTVLISNQNANVLGRDNVYHLLLNDDEAPEQCEAETVDGELGIPSGCLGNQAAETGHDENILPLTTPLLSTHDIPEAPGDNRDTLESQDDVSQTRIVGTRRLLQLAKPQVVYLYLGCLVLLIRLPCSLAIPHFVATTIAALARADFHTAHTEIMYLVVAGTLDAILDFWCVFLFGYANQRIVKELRVSLLSHLLRQEVGFFDMNTSGELMSRLTSDCSEMSGDLTWFFRFSIESVVRITGITTYMLVRSPVLGACAVAVAPLVAAINRAYGVWLAKNAEQVQSALAEANSVAQQALTNVRVVIAFAAERQESERYLGKVEQHYRLNLRQLYMTGIYYMAVSTFLINTVVQGMLLYVGSMLIYRQELTAEVLLAFMLYQGQLQQELLNLFQSYSSLIKSSGAGGKVFSLLDREPPPPATGSELVLSEEEESADDIHHDEEGSMTAPQLNGPLSDPFEVQLVNVSFTYPSRPASKVLSSINLEIPKGKTIALVGHSGCGKSTIANLLQRLYDPTEGKITIDGRDLSSIDLLDYRRRIGAVTQEPVLFQGSILENILYGWPHGSRDDAVQAAMLANADSFIQAFPAGYETEVGERGSALSGGQKQRIAIARAIVKRPSLLLLDEATSALDEASERLVQEALDTFLLSTNHSITTVVIAHRLKTIRNADIIAVLDNGNIVELGSHDELIAIDGRYRRMVDRAGTSEVLPADHNIFCGKI